MNYTNAQKVQFGFHMLEKEVEDWWGNIIQRFDEEGIEDNGTVGEYVARFQELIKYYPHYNTTNDDKSKCLKFVNGLRPKIKKAIGYQKISCFAELVNKSMIYYEGYRESVVHYKSMNDRKRKGQFIGKSYADKGK
ncbi:uncharacterized protein LOC131632450 [Vicia villosa]|uniref:uncharacterized protein LOC131632450 n=1 Tax=Vicia villosa TaxID=3911 RepID=UPI00273CE10E|nr:uncharacterized protein LOC131632450 [Vicia villosa]